MKRIFAWILLALEIPLSLLLASCEQRGDFLAYQEAAFTATVTYVSKEGELSGRITREKSGARRLLFDAPEALSGISVLSDEVGRYFLSYEVMTEEVAASAEAALSLFSLLCLTPTSRIRYEKNAAVFGTAAGEARVEKNEADTPVFISLQTKEGPLSLSISSWEVLP